MPDETEPPRGSIHRLLHNDHADLDATFDELLNAAEAGVDSRTLGEIWTGFESGLRQHMAAEEDFLFPKLERRHSTAIAELRATHGWIRSRLDELGLDVDLHLIRSHQVAELLDQLRTHAATEDAGLYLWAENELADEPPESLIEELATRLLGRTTLERLRSRLRTARR